MAGIKEIKNRINSVKNTRKITNAMFLISSTKLRKAKDELDHTRPYFDLQATEIRRIFQKAPKMNSPYFYPETGRKPAEVYAYLVITADKGLAGAYNQNILKRAEMEMQKHHKVLLYVVGEYGRQYFSKRGIPIEQSFLYTAQNPTFERAREICSVLLTQYLEHDVDEIRIIYSDMVNSMEASVCVEKLLPFERKEFSAQDPEDNRLKNITFEPDVNTVLNNTIRSYLSGFIYGALLDSFCSEQNARMNAMDSANRNAEELLEMLGAEYNRVRQAAITQEITEVAAGAKAQKKKKKKEANKLEYR